MGRRECAIRPLQLDDYRSADALCGGTIGTAPAPLALQKLKLAPALVTPNGDGRGDAATLSYRLTAPALRDRDRARQPRGHGADALLAAQAGRSTDLRVERCVRFPTAAIGSCWPPGTTVGHRCRRIARCPSDRTLASFVGSTPAISPNGDGRLDGLDFTFRLNAAAHVQLRILRAGALVATPFEGDLQAGPQRLSWDGGGLQDGRYTAVVVATDSLMTVKQSVFVQLDTNAPTLRLVSFRLLRFWLSEPGRLTVVLNGRAHVVAVKRAGFVPYRACRPDPCATRLCA